MMQLPGGLVENTRLDRSFKLVSASGKVDMALNQLLESTENHPRWISEALILILDELCGQAPRLERVQALCIADRQAILLAWHMKTQKSLEWFTRRCESCDEIFDVSISLDKLPFSEAAESFPFAHLELDDEVITIRVPNGRDLEFLSQIDDSLDVKLDVKKKLIERLLVKPKTFKLQAEHIEAIETAVENTVPEFATEISCQCPECDGMNSISFRPEDTLAIGVEPLLEDIHKIAQTYHWSEEQIISLPHQRREFYLNKIDRELGVSRDLL